MLKIVISPAKKMNITDEFPCNATVPVFSDPKYREKFGEKWMDSRIAEVRFCRAYAYYLLCRVYGGVILRTEVDGPSQNDKARSSEEDCWNFIITELQQLAPDLPKVIREC